MTITADDMKLLADYAATAAEDRQEYVNDYPNDFDGPECIAAVIVECKRVADIAKRVKAAEFSSALGGLSVADLTIILDGLTLVGRSGTHDAQQVSALAQRVLPVFDEAIAIARAKMLASAKTLAEIEAEDAEPSLYLVEGEDDEGNVFDTLAWARTPSEAVSEALGLWGDSIARDALDVHEINTTPPSKPTLVGCHQPGTLRNVTAEATADAEPADRRKARIAELQHDLMHILDSCGWPRHPDPAIDQGDDAILELRRLLTEANA